MLDRTTKAFWYDFVTRPRGTSWYQLLKDIGKNKNKFFSLFTSCHSIWHLMRKKKFYYLKSFKYIDLFGNRFKEHDFNISFHYLSSPCKSCHLHWVRMHSWYIFSPKGVLPQPTYEIRTFSSMASPLACRSFHFFWLDSYLLWFPGTLSIWLLFRCVLTSLFLVEIECADIYWDFSPEFSK